MKEFWSSFFLFIFALCLMIYLYDPAYIQIALSALGIWLMILGWISIALACVAIVGGGWLIYRRQSLKANRPVDGAYPLQRYKTKDGRTLVFNPNHMVGPATLIDHHTGAVEEIEPGSGWGLFMPLRSMIEQTNFVRAMFPGDEAKRAHMFKEVVGQ